MTKLLLPGVRQALIEAGAVAREWYKWFRGVQGHVDDTSNPHATTAAQVGADPVGSVATHAALTTGVHGVGASTVASTANLATHAALEASVHGFDASGNAPAQAHGTARHSGTIGAWSQIDKTVSSIANITTRSHTALSDIGTNTHAQVDTFIASKAAVSGLASLDGSSKVVQNPASASTSAGNNTIPLSDGAGKVTVTSLSAGAITDTGLTASQAVVTDGSKNLASMAYSSTPGAASRILCTDSSGNLGLGGTYLTVSSSYVGGSSVQIGAMGTGDRSSFIYLAGHGNAWSAGYTDSKIVRAAGENGTLTISNDGTGTFALNATGAAAMSLKTSNTERLGISSAGVVSIPNLTASQVTATDGSKNLVSLAYSSVGAVSSLVQSQADGRVVVAANAAGSQAIYAVNDGGGANRIGIRIDCGVDAPASNSDVVWLDLRDGDSTAVATLGYSTASPYAAIYAASDARLKKGIKDTKVDAIQWMTGLRFREFEYKKTAEGRKLPRQEIGLVAQEIPEALAKSMVGADKDGILHVAPSALIYPMARAIQQLLERIEALEKAGGK